MAERIPTLVFDIETAPIKAQLWRPGQAWVPHEALEADSFVICWSAKAYKTGRTVWRDVVTPEEAVYRNDTRVVASLAEKMREHPLWVAHNASNFDVPRINARLFVLQQEPLTPARIIDTLKLARKSFDLPYNKLDYLAEIVLGDHKLRTDFDLWRRCVQGDPVALAKMLRYNVKDTRLLERVLDKMVPYVKGLPRMFQATTDMEFACPYCGSVDLQKRGFHDTNAGRFQTWQCNGCGRYPRSRPGTIEPRLALVPTP